MSNFTKILLGMTIVFLSAMLCFCLYIDNTLLFFITFGIVMFCLISLSISKYYYFQSKRWKNVLNKYELEINDIIDNNNKIVDAQNKLYFYREIPVSMSVLKSAGNNAYQYGRRYFDLEANEDFIALFENLHNGFYFIDKNITTLNHEKNNLVNTIKKQIPMHIRLFTGNLDEAIGLHDIVKTPKYPEYRFYYKSNNNRVYKKYSVYFNSQTCESFLNSLKDEHTYNMFVKTQRSLMTDKLRNIIKERDNFTCQICGASIYTHPDIVFHIDHIIPVSKGGITTEDNLQTLCSTCNLKKSNKIIG